MKNDTNRTSKMLSQVLAMAALLVLARTVALAGEDGNPKVLPPNSNAFGNTYAEWSAKWWQWALGVPAAQNPVEDVTGQFSGVGQSGHVWFLTGSFGDLPSPVLRSVTVPTGMALFFPVYQWIFGASVGDCNPSNPGVTCDIPTLRQSAETAAKSILTMEVWIDGVPVENLRNYYATSSAFSVTLPPNNVLESFGLPDPAGTYSPQVTAGYWLLLTPLSAGAHTISIHTVPDPASGVEQTIIYNLTVQPGGKGH